MLGDYVGLDRTMPTAKQIARKLVKRAVKKGYFLGAPSTDQMVEMMAKKYRHLAAPTMESVVNKYARSAAASRAVKGRAGRRKKCQSGELIHVKAHTRRCP